MSVIQAGSKAVYWSYMVSFMSYRDSLTYDVKNVFTDQELTCITPNDVERYMKFCAFGVPEPGPDDRPTQLCARSLMVIKKAISIFIPNRLPSWDIGRCIGNPTKSIEVNSVIKIVTRHE
jgi:hypothetical protein